MFHTVFHQLKNPQNIGMIIRSHVAFAGSKLVFTGYEEPYKVKRREKAYSRSLFEKCESMHFKDIDDFFYWANVNSIATLAIEISEEAKSLPEFAFPHEVAIIMGNESYGLPDNVLKKCDHIIRIPQFGPVGSLNVAISASIVMYEITRLQKNSKPVIGRMFDYT
ncbi:MAG: TrmH family RNA methyltransferase [Bacteroidales bacterium]|nr:TrmH family RNA methyltransferase [Bacteroidales bacterium]MCF8457264.1 TrmH family RNA methyltransferase [Bacteroidales bacterium]